MFRAGGSFVLLRWLLVISLSVWVVPVTGVAAAVGDVAAGAEAGWIADPAATGKAGGSSFGMSRQKSAAEGLLDRAIAYHDPDGIWSRKPLRFDIKMGHSEWWDRNVDLFVDNASGIFELHMTWHEDIIEVTRRGDTWTTKLNGSESITREDREKHDLEPEQLSYWSNYFLFLLGLPMKLKDPGTILDPGPTAMTFQGREVLAIRATYEPEVGTDTWYLFFEPGTGRLLGCQFFHDQDKNDGDTMVFEGEVVVGGLRLPKRRTWYSNSDGSLRGTDTIRSVQIIEPGPDRVRGIPSGSSRMRLVGAVKEHRRRRCWLQRRGSATPGLLATPITWSPDRR
ncbi:MAG: DUF6503 family protein [Acidobacteriota bacterium]